MKIYTRKGDDGETGLLGGTRVTKDDLRLRAYGGIDELACDLGLVSAFKPGPDLESMITDVQRDLFVIAACLADPNAGGEQALSSPLDPARITALESWIDSVDTELEPLAAFILPGGCPPAAALHRARAVCRRVERDMVALAHEGKVAPGLLGYVNRLSDLLFVAARLVNHRAGSGEAEV